MFEADLSFEKLSELKSPAYLYDEMLIKRQFFNLKQALPAGFNIFYSMKANSHPDIIRTLKNCGAWIDVASLNELRRALDCGYQGSQIELTGPGKSKEFLEFAIKNNISLIVVESIQELHLIQNICETLQTIASVCVRVSPKNYFTTSDKLIEAGSTQFGIDEEDLPEFFDHVKKLSRIELNGVHTFIQSQYLNADTIAKNFKIALSVAKEVSRLNQQPLKVINFGGGFGVSYYKNDSTLNLSTLKTSIDLTFKEELDLSLNKTQCFVESGRFLTASAGLYIAKVLYTKVSRGKKYAVLNGGFSHHMAACSFGQILKRNFKISAITKNKTNAIEPTHLVGPSCYSLDIIATSIELPHLEPGDYILVHNSGAYGAQFSPSHFLLLEPATEYFFKST